MKVKHLVLAFFLLLAASVGGAYLYSSFQNKPQFVLQNAAPTPQYRNVNEADIANLETGFIQASEVSTPSVVFIKTESPYQRPNSWFFGFDPFGSIGKVASTGSGVIISEDGYIVTNNHVIKNADKIEVVLSGKSKSYVAKLIGADPSSDLALLKIETSNLTPIQFSNSDEVKIGQWVLAVGNPFNLNSTVTAGIVSAKGRNINIVNDQFPIESFIQTDAAINPGNSGGALVDLSGNLVGVNTAIASKTGSYVGYGFAIPSNMVAKNIKDLKEYGEVQRGFLGIEVADIDGDMSENLGVDEGVLVQSINGTNSFITNKIEAGDVITQIDGKKVESKATFDELLAYRRPGDLAKVEISRNGSTKEFDVKLVNKEGTTELIKRVTYKSKSLGAEFELISKLERKRYKISSGIRVSNVSNGKIRQMNIPEGFVFVKVNQKEFNDVKEFITYLDSATGQIRIEGINLNGTKEYRSFLFY